ncbi:MAG: hypothetical protein AAGH17_06280 [Pseudomonadota bacterium]
MLTKTLTIAAVALTVLAVPASAITFDPFPEAITFPDPKPAPTIVQSCADLSAPVCSDNRA